MNDVEFLAFWELLCERHRLAPSSPMTRVYALAIQAEKITAAEWSQAVALSLRFDDFMPSAQKLIDYARPSFKMQARNEWDAAMDRIRQNEPATLPNSLTRTLMNRVTNGVPLSQIETDRLPFVKREFLERYAEELTTQARKSTPALTMGAKPRELPNAN